MIKCQVCGYDNKDDAKFCLNCGAPLEATGAEEDMGVSEEQTVLLDPNAMQARVQEELSKDREREESQASVPPPPPPSRPSTPPPAQRSAPPTPPPAPPAAAASPAGGMGSPPPGPSAGMGGAAGPTAAASAMADMAPAGNPTTYLILSILETLCCCLPFGVVGIIFSIQAMNAQNAGDMNTLAEKLATAKKFLIIGLVLGVITSILAVGIQVMLAMAGA